MCASQTLAVQRAIDREQALRFPRLLRLVHRARFQRHRHRIRFVGARIVELSINQDRDRNQRPLAAAAELQNSHRPRAFPLFQLLGFRRLFLGNFLTPFKLRLFLPLNSRNRYGQ